MLRDFKLKIENFGPINEADLNISKVNIIAGKNASGKTTMSKLLFCIITAFSTDGEYLTYESMKDEIELLINNLQISQENPNKELDKVRFDIIMDKEYKIKSIEKGYEKLELIIDSLEINDKEFFLNTIEKNKNKINGIKNTGIYWPLLTNLIINEFSGNEQILNNYENSKITIYNNKENEFGYIIQIKEKGISVYPTTKFKKPITTNREAIYIETPYFLDYKIPFLQFERYGKKQHHQTLLYQKLIDQSSKSNILHNMNDDEIVKFQKKINNLINGEFKFNDMGLIEFSQKNKSFELSNISTGLKSLGIIQILLENRKLKEHSFLIMDEPEVHLHPEWQVKLAEILILLVKDLNVKLFINSHSPLFIEAIEVYSTKYGLKDETNYYLSQKDEDSGKYNVKHIPNENLYEIYNNLGDPYDIIDKIRGENIANHL